MSILLAEDNAVNQKLATRLLEEAGHTVALQGTDRKLSRLHARQDFDLILMDVQMPEVDGFEATRRIREAERKSGKRTPIIAMTAHAMKGDRENCLAADMDDYIAKPLRKSEFLNMIENSSLPEVGAADRDAAGGEDSVKVFDEEKALEGLGGDRHLLTELCSTFIEQAPELKQSVSKAVQQGNAKDISRAAHTIKGSAGIFSAAPVFNAALHLEQLGRTNDLAHADEAWKTLNWELERLELRIADFLGPQSGCDEAYKIAASEKVTEMETIDRRLETS